MWKSIVGIVAVFAAIVALATKYLHLDADSALWVLAPAVTALALAVLWIIISAKDIIRIATGRSARYGVNLFAVSVIIAFILIMANVIITSHSPQWDTTTNRRNSLAPQSIQVVEGLDQEVIVTMNIPDEAGVIGQQIESQYRELMEMYRTASRQVSYRVIDAISNPQEAEGLPRPVMPADIFVTMGDRTERVSDYQINDLEEKITRALIAVTRGEEKTVYFVTRDENLLDPPQSQAEALIAAQQGRMNFALLAQSLEEEQYDVKDIDFLDRHEVPDDCTVLFIADPTYQFTDIGLAALTNYINRGGQVVVMLDAQDLLRGMSDSPLATYLAQFGCDLPPEVVLDATLSGINMSGQLTFEFGTDFYTDFYSTSNDITENLHRPVSINRARPVITGELPRGVDAETLITASDNAISQSIDAFLKRESPDPSGMASQPIAAVFDIDVNMFPAHFEREAADSGDDIPTMAGSNPVSEEEAPALTEPTGFSDAEPDMGTAIDDHFDPGGAVDEDAMIESDTPAEESSAPIPHARLIVVGDINLIANRALASGQYGNRDFILNAVGRLAAETDLISIRPRDTINNGFTLEPIHLRILLVMLIALPLLVALIGVIVIVQRRRVA